MNYIKPLRPFYGFTQTVFPTVYDDSLSYYESINKMIYTFNQVIKDMNDNYEAIDEIFTDLVDKANEAINRAETAADAAEAAQAAAELAEAGSKAAQALAEAAQKKAEAAQAAAETAEDGAQTAETNAVAAQKAAEAAQALAEAARDAAKAAQTAAEAARDQSKNYAQQSATSAADAAESAKDAEESANNAKNYSESAASSAAAASSSASAAENSANAALAAKTAAEAAQAAAEAAQAAAETAEAGSKTAQAASEAAQKLSEAARDAAQAAQAAAETAKTAAETAATNAAASATAASQSATQAANSASAAAESASNADADATNAAESATHAANSATQAAASATDAADSAELAKEYADQAQVDIDAKLADYLPLEGGKMKGSIKGAYLEISNNQAALVGGDDVGGCTILYNFPTEGEQSRAVRLFISKSGDILNGTIGSMYVGNTFKKIYFNVEDYRAGDNFWQDNIGYDFFPNYMAIKGNRVIMNGENPLGSKGIIDVSFGGEESFSVSANELVYALDNDRSFSLNGNGYYLKHNDVLIQGVNGLQIICGDDSKYRDMYINAASVFFSADGSTPIRLRGVDDPSEDTDAVNLNFINKNFSHKLNIEETDNLKIIYDNDIKYYKVYLKTDIITTINLSKDDIGFHWGTLRTLDFPIESPKTALSETITENWAVVIGTHNAVKYGYNADLDPDTGEIFIKWYADVIEELPEIQSIQVTLPAGTLLFDYIIE